MHSTHTLPAWLPYWFLHWPEYCPVHECCSLATAIQVLPAGKKMNKHPFSVLRSFVHRVPANRLFHRLPAYTIVVTGPDRLQWFSSVHTAGSFLLRWFASKRYFLPAANCRSTEFSCVCSQ